VPTHGGMARLSRYEWLVLHGGVLPALAETVTPPDTNRSRRTYRNFADQGKRVITKKNAHK